MITQGIKRTRRLLATLCALLLLALLAPLCAAQAPIYLPTMQTAALLQTVSGGEHHAIVNDRQATPDRSVRHDLDTPGLVQTRAPFEPFHPLEPPALTQVNLQRPDLGFWACAPPVCRS